MGRDAVLRHSVLLRHAGHRLPALCASWFHVSNHDRSVSSADSPLPSWSRCKAPAGLVWISCLYIRGRHGLRRANSVPVDPNLNLHIIRSATLAFIMFTKDASSNDKELPRSSLRNKVSAFGAAIKPKRNGSSRLIAPSAPQSECSTLVEFAIEDVFIKEDAALEFETEDYMLDADNTAWANGKFSVSSFPQRQKAARANHSALTPLPEQFLDAENTAWGTARPAVSQPIAKSRGRFLSSSRPVLGTSGVEPEYLDPDDRAWM